MNETRLLTRLRRIRLGPWDIWWRLEFTPADMWVGIYWQNHPGKVYVWVCVVPCVPIALEVWKPGTGAR